MSPVRTLARISAILSVIGLTAIGQQERAPQQTDPRTPFERCRAAMPILQNYNNAKYAVFRAGNSADAAYILGPVREAQAALDAMEQPLKGCHEAMQSMQGEQRQDDRK